ncbi:type II toxin-antitoxin system RelE/ParE family toxin [Sphingomonas koreensis]|nr:type II toxin-antitoxin system RelE/ParE family toxin [Sphingomonas koreensis]
MADRLYQWDAPSSAKHRRIVARVVWTDAALAHIDAIIDYIDPFNPIAGRRLAQRILDAGDSLSEFPHRGRPIGDGLRQIELIYPYLIRYNVDGETVIITGVRHGARSGDDAA